MYHEKPQRYPIVSKVNIGSHALVFYVYLENNIFTNASRQCSWKNPQLHLAVSTFMRIHNLA